jgi:lipopolysaccharide biosynthesis regulator YciM
MPELLLVVAVIAGVGWLVVRLVNQAGPSSSLDHRLERDELLGLRDLVDDLKETAWDHRELDSPLATIVIDKIRSYERRRRNST